MRTHLQRFGTNFVDRWPRWTGARLLKLKVHLRLKSFRGGGGGGGGGALKWPLMGGSRLIEVAATAGLTVPHQIVKWEWLKNEGDKVR